MDQEITPWTLPLLLAEAGSNATRLGTRIEVRPFSDLALPGFECHASSFGAALVKGTDRRPARKIAVMVSGACPNHFCTKFSGMPADTAATPEAVPQPLGARRGDRPARQPP